MWQRFGRAGGRGGPERVRPRDVERAGGPVPSRATPAFLLGATTSNGPHPPETTSRSSLQAPQCAASELTLRAWRRVRLLVPRGDRPTRSVSSPARGHPRGQRDASTGPPECLPREQRWSASQRGLGTTNHHNRCGADKTLAEIDFPTAHTRWVPRAGQSTTRRGMLAGRAGSTTRKPTKQYVRKVAPATYTDRDDAREGHHLL